MAEAILVTLVAGMCIGSSLFLIIVLALNIGRHGVTVIFELPEDSKE